MSSYSVQASAQKLCSVRPFWETLRYFGSATALVNLETEAVYSYDALADRVGDVAAQIEGPRKKLVMICMTQSLDCIVAYLAALTAGHAVLLTPPASSSRRMSSLLNHYVPDLVIATHPPVGAFRETYRISSPVSNLTAIEPNRPSSHELHGDLSLVMPTSGSTGREKAVRLSHTNISANAVQISRGLQLGASSRAITSLPLHYIFGLSVLNSHLSVGASIAISDRSILHREFWDDLRRSGANILPSVSFTIDAMRLLGPEKTCVPSPMRIIHSGGRISEHGISWLLSEAHKMDVNLMYGMTETSGRISILPAEEFRLYPRSVGRVVQGGEIAVSDDSELTYCGPNVMLGYATERKDLSLGDECNQRLRTGDIGTIDERGLIHLQGRRSRICKVLGRRVALDEIEEYLERWPETAVGGEENVIMVYHCGPHVRDIQTCLNELAKKIGVPSTSFSIKQVPQIPRTGSGKIMYAKLASNQLFDSGDAATL